jgi:HEAT repeat protein
LGKIGDPKAAGPLTLALDDKHFEVIDEAYIALRDMGLPAGEYLLPMTKNEKPVLRLLAAELLGKIKDSRAYGRLLELLSDEDPGVRKAAAEALGKLENPAAIPALTNLVFDKIAASREAAFESIWKMGRPGIQPLVDALEADPEPYYGCRKFASEQLFKVGGPEIVMPLLKRFSIIQWNKYIGGSWLREDREPLLKMLSSLSFSHNELFVEAMLSEDHKIRYAAAIVLDTEKIAQGFVVMGLGKKMGDSDVEVQLKTIRALRNFSADIVSPILSSAAKASDPQVSKAAEDALAWVQQRKE